MNKKTGDYLKQGLSEAGYITDWVTDGLTGKHQALSEEYDLIYFRRDVTWTKWLEYYQ